MKTYREILVYTLSSGLGCTSPEDASPGSNQGTPETITAVDLLSTHGMVMVSISPGSFSMGSPVDEPGRDPDATQHPVTLTQAYLVSTTEVTQGLWEAIMPSRPWAERERRYDPTQDDRLGICDSVHNQAYGSDQPAYCVTWDEAIQFCNALSKHEGLPPVYFRRGARDIIWDESSSGYRLLTEAEWEYAARAGAQALYAGGGAEELGAIAWHGGNSNGSSHRVGTKSPNAWGLYDMTGNLAEWTWDQYEPFDSTAQTDPKGALYSENGRVIRTSSFHYLNRRDEWPMASDRVASRDAMRSSWASDWLGDGWRFAP